MPRANQTTPTGRHLGSLLSPEDRRDHAYAPKLRRGITTTPPSRVDRRATFPEVWDQGPIGSCEGHAGAAKMAELYPGYLPSRLAIYYYGRKLMGDTSKDSGMYTRDLMKVLQRGVIAEHEWPYDISRWRDEPPALGEVNGIASYSRLRGTEEMIDCIAKTGGMIFSFQVPRYFDSNEMRVKGVIPSSQARTSLLGAHCVIAVGYDLNFKNSHDFAASQLAPFEVEDEMVLVRNSWGVMWGLNGHYWMPLSAVLADDDAWAVHLV